MKEKASPYLPFPEDPAVARLLVQIKDTAEDFGCSVDTLKKNAKSRRFPAYQLAFGMPVFVDPSVVGEFLKSRRDIESVFRKKGVAGQTTTDSSRPAPCATGRDSPVVPAAGPLGELGAIRLNSLLNASPEQIALVASLLSEISEILTRDLLSGPVNLQP